MSSKIKVDNIADQGDNNLINKCGSTITLGANGDTIELASGASQTGFGRTGTVDWQTGSIKTSTFTAVDGQGFFADTSSGAFTMNLPAGSAGSIVSVVDYTNTFQTNNLTISPNGSQKIGGTNASATLDTQGQSVTFIYVDDTEGWKNIQDSTSNAVGNANLVATGGTITTCGNFKIHTFTGPGTFTVCNVSSTAANNTVGYFVLAGGGGGGAAHGGGGGAGGFREGRNVPVDNFTASPLVANAPTNAVTVTAQAYPITVGGGGAGGDNNVSPKPPGTSGSNSVFSTITSTGGGGGATESGGGNPGGGKSGGSGGGGTYQGADPAQPHADGGAGNTPPVSPPQGQPGGTGHPQASPYHGAGGGGAKDAGSNHNSFNGAGGDGHSTSITGSAVTYGGGGGAGGTSYSQPGAGAGGAGGGGAGSTAAPTTATSGTANTGGGGGGAFGGSTPTGCGGAGGSGIVVIRYKYQ